MIRVEIEADGRISVDAPETAIVYVDADWLASERGSIPYAAVVPGDSIVFADGRSLFLPLPPDMDADTAVARAFISVARSAAAAVEDVSADSIDVVGAGIVASATRSVPAGIPNCPPAARRPAAIVEATGEAANIREACGRVEDLGIVVLAGETNRRAVELNLYPDVHVRGLTLVGVPRPSEEDLLGTLDSSEETEAACLAALTRAQSGAPTSSGHVVPNRLEAEILENPGVERMSRVIGMHAVVRNQRGIVVGPSACDVGEHAAQLA